MSFNYDYIFLITKACIKLYCMKNINCRLPLIFCWKLRSPLWIQQLQIQTQVEKLIKWS